MDKKSFIEFCNRVHNNKYEYNSINQNDIKTRDSIDIICKKHGKFKQRAWTHKSGSGCPKCYNESISKKLGNGVDLFIKKSKDIHGDKYDYSKVKYINNDTPVDIICKKHGVFSQKPKIHIFRKSGCNKCNRISKDEILNRSNKIHNNKYRYKSFVYDDSHTVNSFMKIECPIHGYFSQLIKSHLRGVGCPYCKESKGEKFIESILIKNGLIRGDDYIRQYKFSDCRNKYPLPFDFFLPKISVVIEYDGDQHSKVVTFFGGFEEYEKRKINDSIKSKYCSDNGITLLRFSGVKYLSIENDIIKYLKLEQ
jgi:very-short-patch-repair endonuclease